MGTIISENRKKALILLQGYYNCLSASKQRMLKKKLVDELDMHQSTIYRWLKNECYPPEKRAVKIITIIDNEQGKDHERTY